MSLCGILVREKDRRILKKNMKKKDTKEKKKFDFGISWCIQTVSCIKKQNLKF